MFAACAVALVGAVQAAEYKWTVMSSSAALDGWKATTDDTAYSPTTAQSGLAWMLIYSDANGGLAETAALTALRGDGIDSKYILASGTTGADGKIAKTSFTTDSEKIALDAGGKLNAYLVILNDDDSFAFMGIETGKAADKSGGVADMSYALAMSAYQRDIAGTKDFGGKTKTGWYSTVPEPTSGLLLLLGVAGLALRRKQK